MVNKKNIATIMSINKVKTLTVKIQSKVSHSKYGKIIKKDKTFQVHNTHYDTPQIGDIILVAQTKPISKNKTWKVVSLLHVSNAPFMINE
uniref:Ribosomal protein S17 n=1 Tax=Cyanidium sp. THAL103 TaxID=3027999 RepID=A0A9Y1I492_9RHOD|nr:ribosomal protein S17 [Cyanidium sp. THAL103]